MSLTSSQEKAVRSRGNVLVIAGAGTGKTKTLVERCLSIILSESNPVSIEEILMVTFTDAAAAEMRKRIRERLEQESSNPDRKGRCEEQLALLDSAAIGTIHSFCFNLIRQHFYELEIDPQAAIMPKEESDLLAAETLHELLASRYADTGEVGNDARNLVRALGDTSDDGVRRMILRIHEYAHSVSDPGAWLEQQIATLEERKPKFWVELLIQALPGLKAEWLDSLQNAGAQNSVASECIKAIAAIRDSGHEAIKSLGASLTNALQACEDCPQGKKGAFLKPIQAFRKDASFLVTLLNSKDQTDTLAQDWEWFRKPMLSLVKLARDFASEYAQSKRELGVLNFQDLEQHALRLLWDFERKAPTPLALEWRNKFKFIFVDEYQDINKAQDKIITALSREGAEANRFLVGDVKQSIYRFRLASPDIFRTYAHTWNSGNALTVPLAHNFRSREAVLNITNSLFGLLMRSEFGGVDYSTQALQFGAPEERNALTAGADKFPRVELHLNTKDSEPAEADEASARLLDLMDAEKEARLVGLRLLKLMAARQPIVWDESLKDNRAPIWGDVAVLLRAPSTKAESYSKAFSQLGIPLEVAKRGFFDSIEISDLLCLLSILDNPLQDIPLLAVLHSPLGNFTLNELAEVRLSAKKVRFFSALALTAKSAAKNGNGGATTSPLPGEGNAIKAKAFLDRLQRWRRLIRQSTVAACLETILAETRYCEWLLGQDRGAQRNANVRRLISLAREFDQFQRRGLLRFLSFIEAQKESDVEPAVAAGEQGEAVRLMSVHQSKGLEFPIVVLPDLAKNFNDKDLKGSLMVTEAHGVCSDIKPPQTRVRYPSLPLWLARRSERRELLGEELRLLYVAMTRARDMLILTASPSARKLEELWRAKPSNVGFMAANARSAADWLGLWVGENGFLDNTAGNTSLAVRVWKPEEIGADAKAAASSDKSAKLDKASEEAAKKLVANLTKPYSHIEVTTEPAKTSVSALRRKAADTESETSFNVPLRFAFQQSGQVAGADRGTAHHTFLQQLRLDGHLDVRHLRDQANRMVKDGVLTTAEASSLDLEGVAAFWTTEQARELLRNNGAIRRELPFTTRFSPKEIAQLTGLKRGSEIEDEFVIVQGVADLVAVMPHELWLFDFKTDRLTSQELLTKQTLYRPQMILYAAALTRIFGLPVTKSYLYFLELRALVPVTDEEEPFRLEALKVGRNDRPARRTRGHLPSKREGI